jgi:uncharacterized protein (TIGR00369 family)
MASWPQVSIETEKEFEKCYGCGQENPLGLKMKITQDGKTARAEFVCDKLHQGWSGIVHGGVIAALLDEAMSYTALFERINTVTARIEVRVKRPIHTGERLLITARITKKNRKLVETRGTIEAADGTLLAEAKGLQYVVSNRTEPI